LRWSDVDSDTIRLRTEPAKNRKARSIPIAGAIAEVIERRRKAQTIETPQGPRFSEYVFHFEGEPILEFRKTWATAAVASGLGRMHCPHC